MRHLNLFYTALHNITRYPVRSMVIILCLIAILLPFLSAMAVLEGVKKESFISAQDGADVYLTMDMYGRNGVIPIDMAEPVRNIEGVIRVMPRAISRIYVGGKLTVLLGIPIEGLTGKVTFVKGGLPKEGEVVIGRRLAREMKLDIGDSLSLGVRIIGIVDHVPYVVKREFRISGIFDSSSGLWTSNLILMNLNEMIGLYEMDGFITDMAIYVRPGLTGKVSEELQRMNSYFRIQTKDLVMTYLDRGFSTKGGIFLILYTIAFAIGIPALLVSSGLGLTERKREVGILKALGWRTVDVMEMVFFECLILSLLSVPMTFIISFFWIKVLNAPFIAQIFIPGAGIFPDFPVPSLFLPMPLIITFLISIVITATGSIYTTWRTSVVPPVEAMR
ncbi:MAG: ABC transporter permease [Thermodesulfovibrionales bacterium]